jgi:hypothetical protein
MTWRPTYEILFDNADVVLNPDCACPTTYPPPAPWHYAAEMPPSIPIVSPVVSRLPTDSLAETLAWLHHHLLHMLLEQAQNAL